MPIRKTLKLTKYFKSFIVFMGLAQAHEVVNYWLVINNIITFLILFCFVIIIVL